MKKLLAVFFLASSLGFFVYAEVQAQALQLAKPFTGKVNKAVSSAVGKRLNTMGFAANDPIYSATIAASQTVVNGAIATGSVAATVASIGSAPVWLSVALGIGAVYELYDFSVGQFEVKPVPNAPAVQLSQGTVYQAPPLPPAFDGTYNTLPTDLPYDYADPGVGNAIQYPSDQKICATMTGYGSTAGTYCGNAVQEIEDQAYKRHMHAAIKHLVVSLGWSIVSITPGVSSGPTKVVCTISPLVCPDGIRYNYSRAMTINYAQPDGGGGWIDGTMSTTLAFSVFNNPLYVDTSKAYTLNDAAARLQTSDLSTLADPELLAAIANKIWQQAAQQPGYEGAPYNAADPITAEDILADIAAGLYPHPTNYDLLSLPSPDASNVVTFDPAAEIQPEAPASSVALDLGPDPGIAAPALEDAPTGASIVAHVMGLMPSFSGFTLPAHTAACEMPTFDFFGNTMTMQPACDLIEGQRSILSTIFVAVWSVSALTFVLRA